MKKSPVKYFLVVVMAGLINCTFTISAKAWPWPRPTEAETISLISGRFSNEQGERQYRLYLPRSAAGTRVPARALVVLLHGCGQTPEDFLTGTKFVEVADQESFAILLPMQERSFNPLACWNWYLPEHRARNLGEASILSGMTRAVLTEQAIDSSRVYLAGFSAGAAMTSILGACFPDIFAAIGVHSGAMFQAASTLNEAFQALNNGSNVDPRTAAAAAFRCSNRLRHNLPTLIFHGDRDTVVNPRNADQVWAQFAQLNDLLDDGLDNQSVPDTATEQSTGQVPQGHAYRTESITVGGKPLLMRYSVAGMAHAWSGGDSRVQYNDPAGPSAAQLLWAYFRQFRR